MDDVLARITAGMRLRIADKKESARAHKEANPRQSYSRRRKDSPKKDYNADNRYPPRRSRRQADHHSSEEHTSELQSLMRISSAVFCLKKKATHTIHHNTYAI